jgi:hypothetical protein
MQIDRGKVHEIVLYVLQGKIILATWPSPRTQTRIWYKCHLQHWV